MSFQKSADLPPRNMSRMTEGQNSVNGEGFFLTSPNFESVDEIVAAARAECADFFAGLQVPGFERSARRHG
jgi:hypothetical protein